MSDPAIQRATDLRLDLYIRPRLQIQRPKTDQQRVHGKFVQWQFRNAPGKRKTALRRALRYWHAAKLRHLVVSDDPGQGKTVLSLRIQNLLSDPRAKTQIYLDGRARLVLHWMSRLPPTGKSEPQLMDFLMADESLKVVYPDSVLRQKIINHAIANDRLIIVLDALDEVPGKQKQLLYRIFASSRDTVRWIITGRDWAINRAIAEDNLCDPKEFFRLRIKAFSETLQDQFMSRAMPSVPWRDALEGSHEEWKELLGLPSTLRELLRALLVSSGGTKSLRFSSPSDLFCFSSRQMLSRELKKEAHAEAIGENGLNIRPAKAARIIERAVGAIALEMALRNHWREVIKDNTTDLNAAIDTIWEKAEERFLQSFSAAKKGWGRRAWEWAKNFLNHFEFHGGSAQADLTAESLVFRNVRIQEMNLGRYLSDFATNADLRGSKNEKKVASKKRHVLQCLGNPNWDNSWRCAIRMPIRTGTGKEHGVDKRYYKKALHVLFERPMKDRLRRPTELMWIAEQWLLKIPSLRGMVAKLHQHLATQFASHQQSSACSLKGGIDELLDPKHYVLLCSPNSTLPDDTGSFTMGPDPANGRTVPVKFTKPFAMARYTLTCGQMRCWDNGFEGGEERLAATGISWYDAYYLCRFLGGATLKLPDGKEYRFTLPTEAQWEYACRAGFTGDYGFDGGATDLPKYGWFKANRGDRTGVKPVGELLPNRWKLYDMHGNLWEWCWDWYGTYPDKPQTDPVGHLEGSFRVLRGGSWVFDAASCRAADRLNVAPSFRFTFNGFRLALSSSGIPQSPEASAGVKERSLGSEARRSRRADAPRPEMP
jgi:hypothetical protein